MTPRDQLNPDEFAPDELPCNRPPEEIPSGAIPPEQQDERLSPEEMDADQLDPERLVREEVGDVAAEPGCEDKALVELVRYPTRTEADMFMPWLEDVEIHARVEEIDGGVPDGQLTGATSPHGKYRIMVAGDQLDEARRLLEDFETQREHMRIVRTPEEEPQKIERPGEEP